MLQYVSIKEYQNLYNRFSKRNWQQLTSLRFRNKVFYTIIDDKYHAIDNCADEVYIEEFNTLTELTQFYEETHQLSLF